MISQKCIFSLTVIPADILVELVLKVNKAFIACFIEGYPPQNSTNHERPNQIRLLRATNILYLQNLSLKTM